MFGCMKSKTGKILLLKEKKVLYRYDGDIGKLFHDNNLRYNKAQKFPYS